MSVQPHTSSSDLSSIAAVDRFLTAINEAKPSGEWLRFEPLYDEVKKLREQDDASLPQGVWRRELKRADWSGVAQLCESALEFKTKDLQIAAWLTEAWIHQHGFRGLQRGMQVVNALCNNFWDTLHPLIEDGAIEARISPLIWMSEKLVLPIKSIPVTAPTGDEGVIYAWRDWEAGLYLSNLARTNAAAAATAEKQGMVPQSNFLVSVSLTPAAWIQILSNDITAAIASIDELQKTLNAKLGEIMAPSLTSLRAPLDAIQIFLTRVLNERIERGELAPPAPPAASQPQIPIAREEVPMSSTTMEISAASTPSSSGVIASRAEAYQKLREASEFLMRTEPHSPVPYLVRRAISWGNLSLGELLEELLHKNADLATVYTLLGIKKS